MTPQECGTTPDAMFSWIMGLAVTISVFIIGYIRGYADKKKEKENEDDTKDDRNIVFGGYKDE